MSPLLDKEQIILRLQNLKQYLKTLELLRTFSLKEIESDPFKKGALLHYIQLSAEVCIDVGQMVITAEDFEIPSDSTDIFIVLGHAKILPEKFANSFAPVARFRNLLVHEYIKIDMHKVYSYLRHEAEQFNVYAKYIGQYLKKKRR